VVMIYFIDPFFIFSYNLLNEGTTKKGLFSHLSMSFVSSTKALQGNDGKEIPL
jgi:hypothetical protein